MWSTLVFLLLVIYATATDNAQKNIIKERNELLQRGMDMMLGHDIVLSDSELIANEIIMDLKTKVLDQGFHDPSQFNLSRHFFEYKDAIKETELFKIIQLMPKGAALHIHGMGLLGPDYVLDVTYWDNLFVCFEQDAIQLIFSINTPALECETQWQLMKDARYSSGNVKEFDEELRKYFTVVIDTTQEVYTDINIVWNKFQQYFITLGPMFSYKPLSEQYFYDTLAAFRKDNVMFLEVRSDLLPLYDLEGNVYDPIETAESYKKVVDQFMEDYPDFFGAKLIYAPLRQVDLVTMNSYIKTAKELNEKLPGFLAGFDLVGQEDLGEPLKKFLPALLTARDELDYFFHAGETNWYGATTDENLVDAIILGTKRIGHAYALSKHPYLVKEVIERDIALEVNVISNVVLKLVDDMRNHPLASFLAQGLPVVLSSDDPGIWEAEPMSHDFYVTFVGVASRHADLKLLKKLALNSLYHSTFKDKDKIVFEFEIRWTKFIDSIVKGKW
jgi:adenosine deaminase CECR1